MVFFFWCFGFQFAVHTAQEMTKSEVLLFFPVGQAFVVFHDEWITVISLVVGMTVHYSTIVVCLWIRVTNRSTRLVRIVKNTLRTNLRKLSTGSDSAVSPGGSRCASRIPGGSAIRPLAQIVL